MLLETDKLVIRGGYQLFPYTLDEPQQGRVAVRVTLPDGTGWCAEAPGKASGTPPSTARSDRVDRFVAQPKSPAPAVCPPVPGGSPSGAFVAEAGG